MLPKHNTRVRFPLPAPAICNKKSFFEKAFFIVKTTICRGVASKISLYTDRHRKGRKIF